uniref:Ribonuclease toxin, BrnT, of type II toxin-antitoxin system n=1 Tax=Candidatus Kentrum sp. DK TaxID=2126562 RepID=A0A450T021_9GAMM|nr:MAG: Ribonuclease toxin, BrnT, of type II toxin-antitoxin system [Candidatus Kentron sp. DK]
MKIEFDQTKRDRTREERGLDFARCDEFFAGHHFTAKDTRRIYGEKRYITSLMQKSDRAS